jgi:tetratricopeptide (TPR) repeat protein
MKEARVSRPPSRSRRTERSPESHRKTPAARRRPLVQAALLAAFVLLAAIRVTRNDFVSLDDSLYVGNKLARQGLTRAGVAFAFGSVTDLYWQPLTWLSHELDFELYGTNPAGHHFTSVLLHALAAGLLFLLLLRLGAGVWISAAGALLWVLHPLRVESFAWIAERKDVLCALFFIATVLAYLHHAECPSTGRHAAWLTLGALALMSKPTAVSLAVILPLLDYWPLRRTGAVWQLVKEKVPLVAMTALVVFLTIYGQKQSGSMSHLADVSFPIRLENAALSLVRYMGKVLWPGDLTCFYRYDRHPAVLWVIAAVFVLGTITTVVVLQRRRRPWLLVGWLWFLAALIPNIGLLQAGRQSIADRFTHLAMIGVVVALVFAISERAGASSFRKRVTAISLCATLAVLAGLTWRQIGFWHDSFRLFEHAIALEDSDFVRGALAASFMMGQRYAEAEPHLRAAIDLAPQHPEYHNDLANVLLRTGRLGQAAAEADVAMGLAPNDIPAIETAGLIFVRKGDGRGALGQFDHAVRLGADPVPVAAELNDAGASLASRGRPREAEPLIRRAIELSPALVQARRNLVLVLEDQGRPDEARAALRQAIQATGPPRREYSDLARELGEPLSSASGQSQ